MSPLLEKKYKYIIFEPVDSVRSQLKACLKTPWYDITVNLAGKIFNDNTFKIYPKLSMGIELFGMVQSAAWITGKLVPDGDQTNICLELRPNYVALLAFYIILLIIILKIIGLIVSRTESDWIVIGGLFLSLVIIRSVIHFSIGRLKRRFERLMSVYPEN